MTVLPVTAPDTVFYPERDGNPIADNTLQFEWPKGEPFASTLQIAAERDAERRAREQAEAERDAERVRRERLEARLRSLGLDPDCLE